MLTKLSRETLADQAARNVIAFIQAQALKPGSFLPPETQLAVDLGVSRPIIREALNSTINQSMIRQTDEQLERVQVGHETILTCLEHGDAEESGRAMTAHFADAVMAPVYGLGDGVHPSGMPQAAAC